MKKLILLIMVLTLGVGIMAQEKRELTLVNVESNTQEYTNLHGKIVVSDEGVDIYVYAPNGRDVEHVTFFPDESTGKKTKDKYGRRLILYTCTVIQNNRFLGNDELLAITNVGDDKMEFMIMTKTEGDPFYMRYTGKFTNSNRKGYDL